MLPVPRHMLSVLLMLMLISTQATAGPRKNGFELEPASIPVRDIHSGGPPRDGIPAINTPKFEKATEQDDVGPTDMVLGVYVGGIAKAFPVAILNYHEVVNDWTQQTHMVVTYCPLCGSGMAFYSGKDGNATFGVSGLLYNSNVLLYDHQTESLWSQILGRAVTGPSLGQELKQIPVMHTTWAEWLERHPETYVLSRDTGYKGVNYDRSPYRGYDRKRKTMFPVTARDNRYHPKAWVLGLQVDGVFKAYPFEELAKTDGIVRDKLGDTSLVVRYENETAWAEDDEGNLFPAERVFWFAWYGFHPDTAVFTAKQEK